MQLEALVVDTCIVSYLFKNDTRAKRYEPILSGKDLLISFMTVAEMYEWAIVHKWGKSRILELKLRLRNYAVIDYSEAIAWEWARIRAIKGHPMGMEDAWVAAVATRYSVPLVTHNRKDFDHIPDLEIITAM